MTREVTQPYGDPNMQRIAEWTARMLDASETTAKKLGCSPQAIVAQAALETGWGKSAIGNNVFGIKADASWPGKRQNVATREWSPRDQAYYTIMADFRDYDTLEEGIEDHFQFLLKNTRYANVFDPNNTMSDNDYFAHLAADGYATDPNYASSLDEMLASVQSVERHMTDDGGVCRQGSFRL